MAWADDEIANFESGVAAVAGKRRYKIPAYPSGLKLRGGPVTIHLSEELPEPIERAAYRIVGDLRNLLDQSMHTAALLFGTQHPKKTNFPMGQNETWLDKQLSGSGGDKFKGVPVELHQTIRSYKPFRTDKNGGQGNRLLMLLNDLANSNKHRTPLKVSPRPKGIGFGTVLGVATVNIVEKADGEFEVMNYFAMPGAGDFNFSVRTGVYIKDAGPFAELDAVTLFKKLRNVTQDIITDVEKVCADHGLI